jgi:hypothetical protein
MPPGPDESPALRFRIVMSQGKKRNNVATFPDLLFLLLLTA